MPLELFTAISGAIASFLSGLLGIGGGIVLSPLLLYGPGLLAAPALSVKIITGLTIVQAISGTALGTLRHNRYGNVSGRLVRVMGPTTAVTSLAGALLSRYTPDRLLLGILALFAIIGAAALFLPPRGPEREPADLNVRLAVGLAAVIGFLGGMVGMGAAAFIVAGLIYLLRVPVRVAIGTSLAIGLFAAVAGFIGKAATAQVDPVLAGIVFVAALGAAPVGAAISQRTRPRVLMLLLAGVVAIAGLRMAWQAIVEMA